MEVGSYPQGASPYGALDMAGNVLKWTRDRFGKGFYAISPADNPVGPTGGNTRVYRGGAYHHFEINPFRTVGRGSRAPSFTSNDIGFRCMMLIP